MTSKQHKTVVFAVIPFLAAGGVILDFFTPLGVADWVWYFIPLLLSVYVGGRFFPFVLAAVFTLLTLGGAFLSPPGIALHLGIISRLMGVSVQWLMAFLISQRKQADEELRKLSRAVEQSPASIIITDQAGNIEYVNPKFVELTGYSPGEVIGKNPRILKSGETSVGDYQRLWETITAGREWCGEFHNRKKNGELYWEWASISPICDAAGRITHFLAVKEDITEHKVAENELRKSEARFRSLFENMLEGFAYCRMIYEGDQPQDFVYLTVNSAFEKITGLKDVEGKKVTEVIPGIKESHPELFEIYGRVALSGRPEQFEIFLEPLKVWLAVSVYAPAKNYFVAGFENITKRKQAEETLATEQRLLNSLTTAIPDVIYFKDRESRFIRINVAFVQKHGLPDTRAALGKTDFDLFGEQHARQAYEDEQRIMARGQPMIDREEKEDWKDGHVTWVSSTKMPLRDSTGKIIGIMGISRDITERKQAEQQLAETLDFNQKIISEAPVGILVFKATGQCIFANEAAARTLNATVPQILNQDFRQIESWRVSGLLKMADETLAAKSPKRGEFHFTSTFGKEAWLACHFSFFVRGNEPHLLLLFNDVIERKQADEALANERALLRTLVDHLPLAVYLKDVDGRKTLANRLELEYLGATSEAEVLGKTDFDFHPPERAAVYQAFDHEMIRTGRPLINHEGRFTKPDGSVIHLLASVVPLRDATGRVTGLLGINLDITERKRAEEALRESQALYYSFVEQLPIGVFRKDREGRFVLVNHLFCQMKGMKAGEFLGKTPQEVAAAEEAKQGPMGPATKYAATGAEHHERILQTGKSIEMVEEYVNADGSKRLLHAMKWPVFGPDGKIIGTQGIQLDITELKWAEEHVREQAALLDKAQDAILVLDLNDRIVFWNKSAERIYGWSAAEAIGKNPVDLFLGGAVSPRHAEVIKAVKERGEWSGELQEITKHGETVTVQGRCNVICDEQGRPKSKLIINADITEKKKLEAQFLRAQRMESLGTLAGGIAHDLNNVLTPLLVSVQVLKQNITDADRQRLLEALETNVQRGASLVKQVLAFGRGVAGERASIHPKHIASEIRQIVRETFPKSIVFDLHSDNDLWTIIGDPTQLQQVLLNLCVNARDAMPDGGKLSIRMENTVLDEAYAGMNPEARTGPYVLIKVADTGTGIPKEIQDKIFDPFFTTKEPGKGTGLGLSTTLGIVKSHGGFINCYSEPGKGSTFKVYIPANTTLAEMENAVAGEARLPRGHNELVLVVDDEEPIRELAQKVLERFGYRVLLAADGTEAVSLYQPRRNEIDVVITDMVMPVMDGLATIAALKAVNPEIKIVGSSGLALDGYEVEATKAGVRYFIPKPYTAETMLHTLHEVLNGKS